MHPTDIYKRDDDDGPSPVDRLNSLEPGARAGVITAIVIGTILIIAICTWWCCWPCCCFPSKKNKKNPDRFKNHQDLDTAEAGHHGSDQENLQWTHPPETTQNGFAPHERHVRLDEHKDPNEPPPAYHEVK